MGSIINRRFLKTTTLLSISLLITVTAFCGALLAQSAMFSSNQYNVYGRGLYLDNYSQIYARGYGTNAFNAGFNQALNASYQLQGNTVNNGYTGNYGGGYIQNYGTNSYYNPYRN
jgi:hypothetical protein